MERTPRAPFLFCVIAILPSRADEAAAELQVNVLPVHHWRVLVMRAHVRALSQR